MHAQLRFDGGCRPTNPGHAAFAAVVRLGDRDSPSGDQQDQVIARYIGWQTNNTAEYYGLIVGVKYANYLGADSIDIISDSKLVVNQVLGHYQAKHDRIRILRREARSLLESHFAGSWDLRWEKRDSNTADAFCTEAINWGWNLNPVTPEKIKAKRPGRQHDPFDCEAKFVDLSTLLRSFSRAHTRTR